MFAHSLRFYFSKMLTPAGSSDTHQRIRGLLRRIEDINQSLVMHFKLFDYLYLCGERKFVYTFFRSVGSGMGQNSLEPVLTAVSHNFRCALIYSLCDLIALLSEF